jgi:hypothetical protein
MSLINTRLVNLVATGKLDKWVDRPSRYGAYDFFKKDSNNPAGILTEEMKEKANESWGRTYQIPVIDPNGSISIGNTRSVTISESKNTSQMVTITFATYSFGFTIVPMAHKNNYIDMQQEFNNLMIKYINALGIALDTAALAILAANRTQVFGDNLIYTVNANELEATWAQRDQIFGDVDPLMHANDYYGSYHLIGNTGMTSLLKKLDEQGLYNDKNKKIQYIDKEIHQTNRLGNQSGEFATFYAVNEGSVGMMERFEPDAVNGTKARTGHEWGIQTLPMLDLPCGTYYYEGVSDESGYFGAASAHLTRTVKQYHGFAVDIAFVAPYNSDLTTYANPIMRISVGQENPS